MGKFYAGIYVAGCSVLYSIPINIEPHSSYRTVNTVDLAVHDDHKLTDALDKYKHLQLWRTKTLCGETHRFWCYDGCSVWLPLC
jgi:hypothetical protein